MHRQLQQSRNQVDQLVAAILTARAAEAELAEQRRSSERSEDTRTVLAQQALQQLGEAARAFLAARGVTPEWEATPDVFSKLGGLSLNETRHHLDAVRRLIPTVACCRPRSGRCWPS